MDRVGYLLKEVFKLILNVLHGPSTGDVSFVPTCFFALTQATRIVTPLGLPGGRPLLVLSLNSRLDFLLFILLCFLFELFGFKLLKYLAKVDQISKFSFLVTTSDVATPNRGSTGMSLDRSSWKNLAH